MARTIAGEVVGPEVSAKKLISTAIGAPAVFIPSFIGYAHSDQRVVDDSRLVQKANGDLDLAKKQLEVLKAAEGSSQSSTTN